MGVVLCDASPAFTYNSHSAALNILTRGGNKGTGHAGAIEKC